MLAPSLAHTYLIKVEVLAGSLPCPQIFNYGGSEWKWQHSSLLGYFKNEDSKKLYSTGLLGLRQVLH